MRERSPPPLPRERTVEPTPAILLSGSGGTVTGARVEAPLTTTGTVAIRGATGSDLLVVSSLEAAALRDTVASMESHRVLQVRLFGRER